MKCELINTLYDVMKWLVVCPALGLVFTISLLNIFKAIGLELKNLKVTKVWCYVTLFVFGLCVLLEVYV